MSFSKSGGSAALANESKLPHIVEMKLPADGFQHQLRREMEEFHRSHDIKARFGRRQRRRDGEFCRWCFADATHADLFHARYGGMRLVITSDSSAQPVTDQRRRVGR